MLKTLSIQSKWRGGFFLFYFLIYVIHALVFGSNMTPYVTQAKQMAVKALHFQGIFATVAEAIIVCNLVRTIY